MAYHVLLNVCGDLFLLDRDGDRLAQEIVDEFLDIGRHRRREEERLAFFGRILEDLLYVMDETHVQHAVRLVQDNGRESAGVDAPAIDEIEDAPRGADDEVIETLQLHDLRADSRAAHADGGEDLHAACKFAKLLFNLDGELARRGEDECPAFSVLYRGVDDGYQESRRLAGAGVGKTYDIAPFENKGDDLVLNGRGSSNTRLADVGEKRTVDTECLKGVDGRIDRLRLVCSRIAIYVARDIEGAYFATGS